MPSEKISPSAPIQDVIIGVRAKSVPAQNTENIIAQTKIWFAIDLALLIRPAPMYCAIKIEPAIVIPCPKLIIVL